MIIQLANIISGFILAAPKIAEFGGKNQIEKLQSSLLPYQKTIGIIELALGLFALIERVGIFHIGNLGSSYPQAIPAILAGLILSEPVFHNSPKVTEIIGKLKPHGVWIGLWTIAAGIISIFFGCIFCFFYF